jgi:hypothetical protein
MSDHDYEIGLDILRNDWGGLTPDPARAGILLADNDPTTGLLVGRFAPLIAEIINRAIKP